MAVDVKLRLTEEADFLTGLWQQAASVAAQGRATDMPADQMELIVDLADKLHTRQAGLRDLIAQIEADEAAAAVQPDATP